MKGQEMFTGIVECIAEIQSMQQKRGIMELSLSVPQDISDSKIGDSFCIQGACLTAVNAQDADFDCIIREESF